MNSQNLNKFIKGAKQESQSRQSPTFCPAKKTTKQLDSQGSNKKFTNKSNENKTKNNKVTNRVQKIFEFSNSFEITTPQENRQDNLNILTISQIEQIPIEAEIMEPDSNIISEEQQQISQIDNEESLDFYQQQKEQKDISSRASKISFEDTKINRNFQVIQKMGPNLASKESQQIVQKLITNEKSRQPEVEVKQEKKKFRTNSQNEVENNLLKSQKKEIQSQKNQITYDKKPTQVEMLINKTNEKVKDAIEAINKLNISYNIQNILNDIEETQENCSTFKQRKFQSTQAYKVQKKQNLQSQKKFNRYREKKQKNVTYDQKTNGFQINEQQDQIKKDWKIKGSSDQKINATSQPQTSINPSDNINIITVDTIIPLETIIQILQEVPYLVKSTYCAYVYKNRMERRMQLKLNQIDNYLDTLLELINKIFYIIEDGQKLQCQIMQVDLQHYLDSLEFYLKSEESSDIINNLNLIVHVLSEIVLSKKVVLLKQKNKINDFHLSILREDNWLINQIIPYFLFCDQQRELVDPVLDFLIEDQIWLEFGLESEDYQLNQQKEETDKLIQRLYKVNI